MPKAMRLRDLVKALESQGCELKAEGGKHSKWSCPCGGHLAIVPRHKWISPGVVGNTIKRMACLPEGWLQ